MKYNITEKLKFNEDPVLVIRDKELTIKSDADVILRLMDVLSTKGEVAGATEVMDLLLSASDQKKLSSLHLKMTDYIDVIKTAISLALGEDPEEEDKGE